MDRKKFFKLSGFFLFLTSYPVISFANSIEYLIGKDESKLIGNTYKLNLEAFKSFEKLKNDALKDGIKIRVVSAYRSFEHQQRIWNRKFEANKILGLKPLANIKKIIEYSTIPGTSRHHWGTDLDIVEDVEMEGDELLAVHFQKGGKFEKLKAWLNENSEKYGYYEVYTNDPNRKGFKYEPWHFSYKPISKEYLKKFMKLDLHNLLKESEINGAEFFDKDFVNNYFKENILSINNKLLPNG